MIAVLSDVHGNLEALDAVLADAASFGVDAVHCLGDMIGYGPDPIPCVERAMEWAVVLQGEFEHAAVSDDDPASFIPDYARDAVRPFRSQLERNPNQDSIREFLTTRPTHFVTTDAFLVHGSPRNHLHEYLFPEDIYNPKKMEENASRFDSICLCGHTHVPGVFHRGESEWEFVTPAECNGRYEIGDGKVICNVGSVGQPRDGDSRACYVLFTPERVVFRRVDYDIDRTVAKLHDGGDDFPGQRLRSGV